MEEDIKKSGKSRNILKGVLYTGIAGIAGAGIYLLSKYRHMGGRATYTIAGLALLVSAPSIMDIAKTYIENHARLEEIRIYSSVKKDSIDAIIHLNAPKDTSTFDINKLIDRTLETSKAMEERYRNIVSDNSKEYERLLERNNKQYDSIYNALVDQNRNLKNTIVGLRNIEKLSYITNNIKSKDINYLEKQNKSSLEKIASQNSSAEDRFDPENIVPAYYFIDADKSDGEIEVFGICSDGSKKNLSISSKASFAMNGGPADGSYVLKNKGARYGELYPGFLEMENPVGISGAGENNQYLEEIQEGALANKTGIRIPNEIYTRIARLVDERRTVINVHE